jgi:hypothetical protein
MLMGVTSWELGALRVPLIMVPDKLLPIDSENPGQPTDYEDPPTPKI